MSIRTFPSALAFAFLASCYSSPEDAAAVEAAIQGDTGVDDVVLESGRVARDARQAARDATVRVSGGCTGTLVSPRVVLTAAHCVDETTPTAVVFGPRNTVGSVGTVPDGTPAPVPVAVVGCTTHPDSSTSCGEPAGFINQIHDIAMLLLAERVDAGASGEHGSPYPAIPAQIVTDDPWDAFHNYTDPSFWNGTSVIHVGYGQRGLFDETVDVMRQFASSAVTSNDFSTLRTNPQRTFAGDSGGPIYLADPDDGSPRRILAVLWGGSGSEGLAVRLTSGTTQPWLAEWLGPKDDGYPGTMVTLPSGETVWTGDLDLPPRTDSARLEIPDAHVLDPDGDGLVGDHDNCEGFYNPNQLGEDATRLCCTGGGGPEPRPLCRDRCPLPAATPTPPATSTLPRSIDCNQDNVDDACEADADNDGVPALCDNCPTTFNASQADCNADAVAAFNASRGAGVPESPVLGDACDPDPCGETRVREASSVRTTARTMSTTTRFDLFEVDARVGSASQSARTGYRFCACLHSRMDDSAMNRTRCVTTVSPSNGGCVLRDNPPRYDAALEARPWRWVTLSSRPAHTEGALTYAAGRDGNFQVDVSAQWRVSEDDRPRWQTSFGDVFPAFTTTTGLPGLVAGVLWTHTPGPAAGGFFTADQRERRSHYWSGQVAQPYQSIPILVRITPITPLVFFGGFHDTTPFVVRVAPGTQVPAGPLIFSRDQGVPAGTSVTSLFEYQGAWVAASEPDALLDPAGGLRHVALDASTGHVEVVLAQLEGVLADADGVSCPGQKPCPGGAALLSGLSPSDRPLGARYADLDPWAPPGVFVLSARRQRLWWLAGDAQGGGGTLATYDGAGDVWVSQHVPTLGAVLAAVYSPRDQVLWVLDQVGVGAGAQARLIALWPERGEASVAKVWPRTNANDRFALAVDPAGRLYVAAGGQQAYAVAALEVTVSGNVAVLDIVQSGGRLEAGMLRASERGAAALIATGQNSLPEVVSIHPSVFFDGKVTGNLSWLL